MMKTAIVTGATGFIGKALTMALLESGYHVIAVVRDVSKLSDIQNEKLECISVDFSNYNKLSSRIQSADIFYHLAWEGAYGPATLDYSMQMNNVIATCEAIKQASTIGCKKFVFAGTVAELEMLEHLDKNICSPRGTCIYASAKLCAEMMGKTLATQYNIEFNTGLFANIIGPGDFSRRSTNSIVHQMLSGKAPKLVKGDGLNDWLYIKDAVRLILAMGEHGVNMKTYYIGHTELWPLRKIIEKTRDIIAPDMQLEFGTIPDAFLTNYNYTSTTALFEDTGCKAEVSFNDAIRETAAWVQTLNWEKT